MAKAHALIRWTGAATLALLGVSVAAVAADVGGTYVPRVAVDGRSAAVTARFGKPIKLPASYVTFAPGRHICLTNRGGDEPNWLGEVAASGTAAAPALGCSALGTGTTSDFYAFDNVANKPLFWVPSGAASIEPRAAVVLTTQQNRRPLYACRHAGSTAASLRVGYVGDDGICYSGIGVSGSSATYEILTSSTAADQLRPRYGMLPAGRGYTPRGAAAAGRSKFGTIVSTSPKTRTLCAGRLDGTAWPGWINPATGDCDYFDYRSGSTVRRVASSFEVLRPNASDPMSDYKVTWHGGKAFYWCTARGPGPATTDESTIYGFTNDKGGCTDGTNTSRTDVEIVRLPDGRG